MYDVKKAESKCSIKKRHCRLNLSYLSPQYVVVETPDTDLSRVYVEISFITRFVTYIVVLGVAIIITCLIMKSLGSCHDESYAEDSPVSREVTETDPILPQKEVRSIYGTCNEEEDCGRSSSSEDLYDGRICVICYDNPRNCFFVPCGHCVTCQKCALRL
ncbi:hypothetical protein P3S67_007171 [Capsicum chacoense]